MLFFEKEAVKVISKRKIKDFISIESLFAFLLFYLNRKALTNNYHSPDIFLLIVIIVGDIIVL